MEPTFFATPSEFRDWLERHHATARELLVGYYKKGSGKPSITWPESVDEAVCFGWIDGVRRGSDDERYTVRFTPRRPGSIWSAVNIRRAKELIELGSMRPAGIEALEARRDDRSAIYAYEQRDAARLGPEREREFRQNRDAWEDFESRPPSYRKAAIHWVTSAKQEETRRRRLAELMAASAAHRTVRPLTPRTRERRSARVGAPPEGLPAVDRSPPCRGGYAGRKRRRRRVTGTVRSQRTAEAAKAVSDPGERPSRAAGRNGASQVSPAGRPP